MARPLRIDYPNAFYHVTCRGNERKDIYWDDHDRSIFLEKLQASLGIYTVKLHCYVLMDNHFHLIVETPKANLSEFMRHFNVCYTVFYNRRHRRVGHLFQGRFKAILVEADRYLLELSRYVHLNPVRTRARQRRAYEEQLIWLQNYPWSSLDGYLLYHQRREDWVVYERVLGYVGGSRKRYAQFVKEGLQRGYSTPWEGLKGQVVLGGERFWMGLRGRFMEGSGSAKEQPSLREIRRIDPEDIISKVAGYFRLMPQDLRRRRSGYRDQRALVMEMMYRYSEVNQGEIGEVMGGVDYTSVSRERRLLREKIDKENELRRWSREVEKALLP